LNAHNWYRAEVGVPPLAWSKTLVVSAGNCSKSTGFLGKES
jgi:uncharacterized protein YkwD